MHTNLDIQIDERTFSILEVSASAVGKTPTELASSVVECIYGGERVAQVDGNAARRKFEQTFGSVDLGYPIGIANESIDADLVREYQC